ncbi:hypothetical protein HY605_00610 [Candidatus Peregrinibacteria bacterium]|nr:hypothetical protein [Candidatus Peregrinibacteria bacterium]
MLFFNYGALYTFFSGVVGNAKLKGLALILITILILFALFIYTSKVMRACDVTVKNINKLFCIIAAVLLLTNTFSIVAQWREILRMSEMQDKTEIPFPRKVVPLPDIYFIILDEYAAPSQMRDYFHSDMSPFVEYLKQKGFMVTELKTRSVATNLLIEARMNMAVAGSTNAAAADSGLSESIMESLNLRDYRSEKQMFNIRNSKVVSSLKSIGYYFVNIGSWFSYTRYNRQADENINTYGFQSSNEVSTIILNSSVLRLLFISRYFHRTAVLDAFAALDEIPVIAGKPKFILTAFFPT